jgi:hypothetical protein
MAYYLEAQDIAKELHTRKPTQEEFNAPLTEAQIEAMEAAEREAVWS